MNYNGVSKIIFFIFLTSFYVACGSSDNNDPEVECVGDAIAPPNWHCLTHIAYATTPLGENCSAPYKGTSSLTATNTPDIEKRESYYAVFMLSEAPGFEDVWQLSDLSLSISFDRLFIYPDDDPESTTNCGIGYDGNILTIRIQHPYIGDIPVGPFNNGDYNSIIVDATAEFADANIQIKFDQGSISLKGYDPDTKSLCGSFQLAANNGATLSGSFNAYRYCENLFND